MPDDEYPGGGGNRRQFILILASAVGVVALVAGAVIGVHSWRDSAERDPAADVSSSTTSSGGAVSSPSVLGSLVSSVVSSAVSTGDPVVSSAPIVTHTPTSSSSDQPSAHPSATARHTSPAASAPVDESHLNFETSMRLSATHVLVGQHTRVTVTVRNAGHGIDPPAEVSIGSMVPSDDFSDAPPSCTIADGGVDCPIPSLRAGQDETIAFTVTTGSGPGDNWDDEIFGQLAYADSFGRQQQLPAGYAADLQVDGAAASPTPTGSGSRSGSPSTTPSTTPSPSTSAASSTAS